LEMSFAQYMPITEGLWTNSENIHMKTDCHRPLTNGGYFYPNSLSTER
jgi:hypothetical protein